MLKRTVCLAGLIASLVSLFALSTAPAASASMPWWQVITGSRPTNMWEPTDNEQEIEVESGPIGAGIKLEVKGEVVGCLGTGPAAGFLCPLTGFAAIETAAQLEPVLESAFETSAVEVTGGPVGSAPFLITTPDRSVPAVGVTPAVQSPISGSAEAKILAAGGSGRLVLTATNIGDAPVDATDTPVEIVDELPDGIIATGFEAFAGTPEVPIPVDCTLESVTKVACLFEGELPPYEAIEIEIFGTLTGTPPAAGAPGKVTVFGGNAPPSTSSQTIKVSPEKTPFGFEVFSTATEEEGGGPVIKAGSHPFQMTTTIQFNAGKVTPGVTRSQGTVEQPAIPRNVRLSLPAGLVGNATQVPVCEMADFYRGGIVNECGAQSAIGAASVTIIEASVGFRSVAVPVFNLRPAQGEPARFGFTVANVPIVIDTAVDPDHDYRIIASVNNASQLAVVLSTSIVIWGSPGDPRHDLSRGWSCAYKFADLQRGPCERPAGLGEETFLREPVNCTAERVFSVELEPWNTPLGSVVDRASTTSSRLGGCDQVPFDPTIAASPTSKSAQGSSGLAFQLDMPNDGLLDKDGTGAIAEGQAKKVEVTLPAGVTVNPSQAEGLAGCGPAEYARETASSLPGQGCPEASKVGNVEVDTPLLEEKAKGAVYVAAPYDNPFDTLLALYMVAKIPERGVLVKQAGKVQLDPKTGQIVTVFDGLPQIPFDSFRLSFFGGDRAPLVLPPKCGSYDITAKFTPWHAPDEVVQRTSSFSVDQGANGGACPSEPPPFNPSFTAGSTNNAAGSFSPLSLRLTRQDGEGEFSRFSVKLPKGLIGKLAGIPFCSDAAIAAAEARTGPNGGKEELASPSCPAASQLGRTLVGAGVGPALSYAPGKIYLAGPYQGAKLSIVAIATATVGPFDLGNVVIRQALRINPETAEVTSDGSGSAPIPHILQGVVVHARDITVYIDRDNFVLNPTSCERMSAAATVTSQGGQSEDISSPFQAAGCASLGFTPKLSIKLKGGTKRNANPALTAVVRARPGDANIGAAKVTLPHSAFLDQSHIKTVCTRVQFNSGAGNGANCPAGSVYGKAQAITPLLDEPLSGPVYLRSSSHPLPDMVVALHSSKIDINLVGRIDSGKGGGIRTSFESVPDASVTSFTLRMRGGKRGLIVNSTNLCASKNRAVAEFTGQNGKVHDFRPLVRPTNCKKQTGKSAEQRHRRTR